jgi:hypothetical protein
MYDISRLKVKKKLIFKFATCLLYELSIARFLDSQGVVCDCHLVWFDAAQTGSVLTFRTNRVPLLSVLTAEYRHLFIRLHGVTSSRNRFNIRTV